MIPKAKKSKKTKRPIEQVPRFEIIKLQNLLHISIMVRVLWTVYGWREKRIGYFLEAYMSLLGEVWDQRCTVNQMIDGTKDMTGHDIRQLVDDMIKYGR